MRWSESRRGWEARGELGLYMHRRLPSGRTELLVNPHNQTGWVQLGMYANSIQARDAAEHYEQFGVLQ